MRKSLSIAFLGVLYLTFFLVGDALADSRQVNSSDRNLIIEKALDYTIAYSGKNSDLLRSDIDYTDESYKNQRRDEIIDKSLDKVAWRVNQQNKSFSSDTTDVGTAESREDFKYETLNAGEPHVFVEDEFTEEYTKEYLEDIVEEKPIDKKKSLNDFKFGSFTSYIEYKEPGLMRDKGVMYGIFGSYTHRTSQNKHITSFNDVVSDDNKINMFRIDGLFSWGYVDYDSQGTGSMEEVRDFMFETRGLAGYDFPVSAYLRVTPYMGIGYRYLNDDTGGRTTTTGHHGYERESRYFYVPFGVEVFTELTPDWSVSAVLEYDWLLSGKQKSHFEDIDPSYNTIENDQKTGYGLKGYMNITKNSKKVDLFIEPFIRYWSIEDSEIAVVTYSNIIVGYGQEPENNSMEYGVNMGARF